jgi:DNA transposition AAA+ family ATPase
MENIKVDLRKFMEARGLSLRAVSKGLGFAPSTLSPWINGVYEGNVTGINETVKRFLDRQREIIKVPEKIMPFVMTSVAERVFEVARIAHLDGEIGVCHGPAGIGKTEAIKEYARHNPDVMLIEADLGHTAKALFSEIHQKLGMEGFGTVHGMFEDVVSRLKGSDMLIIVDEAEHLPYKALELVRRVHDKAGVGILLSGMPRLIHNLRGRKGEYAQLYSRIGIAVRLETLREGDTRMVVDSSMPRSNGLWKVFHETSHGNTRTLGKLILRSTRVAELNNTPVSPDIVRETAKTLII